jgi:thiopurine S-methyltransferase
VALPKAMRDEYTRHLMSLSGHANQLLLCFEYDPSHMDGPPFSVPPDEVTHHYSTHYQLELVEQFPVEGGLKGICPAREQVWVLTRQQP